MRYEITLLNWEKYQGRNDAKKMLWFKMSNALYTDWKMQSLCCEDRDVLLYIMCEASVANKQGYVVLLSTICSERTGHLLPIIQRSLMRLKRLRILTFKSVRNAYGSRTESVRQIRLEEKRLEKIPSLLVKKGNEGKDDSVDKKWKEAHPIGPLVGAIGGQIEEELASSRVELLREQAALLEHLEHLDQQGQQSPEL